MGILFKVYATILQGKLEEEVETRRLVPDVQAGFRRERSTIDNLYILNYGGEADVEKKE